MSAGRTGTRTILVALSATAVVAGLVAGTTVARSETMPTAYGAPPVGPAATPSPASGLQPSGRLLTPAGEQVALGPLPMGGAVTDDGRFLWTVSSGVATNDVRIVDLAAREVCAILDVPGASGGIALDSERRLAYVSGLPNARWQPTKNSLPGARGDVVHVFSWTDDCAQAREVRTIPLPLPANPPLTQSFPPPRAGLTTSPFELAHEARPHPRWSPPAGRPSTSATPRRSSTSRPMPCASSRPAGIRSVPPRCPAATSASSPTRHPGRCRSSTWPPAARSPTSPWAPPCPTRRASP